MDPLKAAFAVANGKPEGKLTLPPALAEMYPEFAKIMGECLTREPENRPTFVAICERVQNFK